MIVISPLPGIIHASYLLKWTLPLISVCSSWKYVKTSPVILLHFRRASWFSLANTHKTSHLRCVTEFKKKGELVGSGQLWVLESIWHILWKNIFKHNFKGRNWNVDVVLQLASISFAACAKRALDAVARHHLETPKQQKIIALTQSYKTQTSEVCFSY